MIPFFDIRSENKPYEAAFQQALKDFMNKGQYVLGEEVTQFEHDFATYCNRPHCIGTSNGLDALRLIFEGYLHLGRLKRGDAVAVSAHTYMATHISIIQSGLQPVFVEPLKSGFNMDPQALQKVISEVKAIMVVHVYGELAPMEAIQELAHKKDLLLLEDAAQAHGATHPSGVRAGAFGDAAAFSFYPTKNLGALGDAGAIVTKNDELAQTLRLLGNYGSSKKYHFDAIGFNMRLDNLQARFLSVKLKHLDLLTDKRRSIAKRYLSQIANSRITLPHYSGGSDHVFHLFVVRVENREELIRYVKSNNIQPLIHYPVPPHQQPSMSAFAHISLPLTEQLHQQVVSIPLYPSLSDQNIHHIIEVLNRY